MTKKQNRYDGEFKLNSVKLVLTSKGERTMKAIAEDLGINYWVLVQWKKEYEEFGEAAFTGKRPVSGEQDELRKLKKELETVKGCIKNYPTGEPDFLSRSKNEEAIVWFFL